MGRAAAGYAPGSDVPARGRGGNTPMDITWRKSSYSTSNGGACIEVGTWRKSSYSTSNGGNCVEVAATPWATSPPGGAKASDRTEAAAPWVTSPHCCSKGGDRAEAAPWVTSSSSGTKDGDRTEAAAPLLGRSP